MPPLGHQLTISETSKVQGFWLLMMMMMMMMVMMMMVIMMHDYSVLSPNLGLYDFVGLRMKYLLQRCMFLFNRSIKSWNPWKPSRKTILQENQISSSVFAAWSSRGMKQVSSHQLVNLKGCKPISPFCPVILVE